MALTIDDLFASPDHYLHSFDGADAIFVAMDRAAYHRSIFLDGRISPAGQGSMRVQAARLTAHAAAPAPTSWIFHVAHCGSTLLARALDRVDANLVLREPLALRQTAIAPDPARLRLVAAMLGKRYRADLPTIVKANVPVNFLLPELIALAPGARAVFLHLRLADYLLAILRSADHRQWLRNVTGQLGRHLGDLSRLGDGERAAALWLAQMRAYAAALAALPNARSLDAEAFFAAPAPVLLAAAGHLGAPITAAQAEATAAGPLFATYSKNPAQPFDNAARLARRRELEGELAGEIAAAEAWVARQAGGEDPAVAVAAARLS